MEAAARADRPVLILGEPGVGKELVARRIHLMSPRCAHPFLMIDCSLFYERELQREVFGYRGIGRAAKSRRGLLEFARRGTCYLSRIEELATGLQRDLLEFVNTGRFRRLGDNREIASNVHLIASTDKNLEGFVEGGLFNEELYQRLSALPLRITPLRDRTDDVEALARKLLVDRCREEGLEGEKSFSPECLEALRCFPWPGNYDELLAEICRLVTGNAESIAVDELSFEVAAFWRGMRGDPEVRKVIGELDGYIREFKVLSRLDAEFGDILLDLGDLDLAAQERRDPFGPAH
ncbi:MAG: sigma 54-interacting transcriptional regulator [Planctomycetota bacterium]|nr:sigma 54-interacting transcriptional regulator [Planctomycetota bacterium]